MFKCIKLDLKSQKPQKYIFCSLDCGLDRPHGLSIAFVSVPRTEALNEITRQCSEAALIEEILRVGLNRCEHMNKMIILLHL